MVAIYDKGTKICTYNYTAYGETTIKNEERNGIPLSRIGERSSIRYRGYQIDKETGLYLLKTRCYNSEWGRFITKDTIDYLEPDKVYGLNLYAYCMNDPINYSQTPIGSWLLPIKSSNGKNSIFNKILASGSFRKGLFFGNGTITAFW